MSAIARITAKGQTTIPAGIRAALQAGPGDRLAWEVVAEGVVQVRRVQPLDVEFLRALDSTLEEWHSADDEAAYRDL